LGNKAVREEIPELIQGERKKEMKIQDLLNKEELIHQHTDSEIIHLEGSHQSRRGRRSVHIYLILETPLVF